MSRSSLPRHVALDMLARRTDPPSQRADAATYGNLAQDVIAVTREHPDWANKDIVTQARIRLQARMAVLAEKSAAKRRAPAGLDATGLADCGSDGVDA